ncbi:MAG: IPT/TIG domain-containing protein [Deltaproteobacteria bacterium]|nr:IPT/TIG domain-containing protein [Deltaproteobacteria bacterium]
MVRIGWFLAVLSLFTAATAAAEIKIYKHDQFSENLATAASELAGIPLAVQPGFVKGEAFGQVYTPGPGDYPIKAQAIELILAAPPNAHELTAHATFEFWIDDGDGATPQKAVPDFTVSTFDFLDPGTGVDGIPLKGNMGLIYEFDWNDPDGHPPVIMAGKIRVVVRFSAVAKDMQAEWGTISCAQMTDFGLCGCQNVGVLLDQSTTANANLLHHVTPMGSCGGGKIWDFWENIGITGDAIMRLRVDAQGTCVPDCTGLDCGNNGCGGSCGSCPTGKVCQGGQCEDPGCIPDCAGKNCGSDGCDGVCGICQGDDVCTNGVCVDPGCQPDCTGKECGDDGCGASCGACPGGSWCDDGVCRNTNPADVLVIAISPISGFNDEQTDVSIVGDGFQDGAIAKLGGTNLVGVQVLSESLISATVPKGMTPGTYILVVLNKDETSGFLTDAFEVKAPTVAIVCGDTHCDPGESCKTCPVDCGLCPAEDQGMMPDVVEEDLGTGPGGGCTAGTVSVWAPIWLLSLVCAAFLFGGRSKRS